MTETSNTPYTKFYAHRKMRSASLDHSDGGYTGLLNMLMIIPQ
jgi:hypothetical protein